MMMVQVALHSPKRERPRSLRVARVVGVDDERLRESHCGDVWARVSDFVEQHDSSALDGRVPSTVPASSLLTWVDRGGDESSSVLAGSCWGEMGDRIDDDGVEWGFVQDPKVLRTDPEVPQLSQRLLTRRVVLVGGGGSHEPLAFFDLDDKVYGTFVHHEEESREDRRDDVRASPPAPSFTSPINRIRLKNVWWFMFPRRSFQHVAHSKSPTFLVRFCLPHMYGDSRLLS